MSDLAAVQAYTDAYGVITQNFYNELHEQLKRDARDWDRTLDLQSQIAAVEELAFRLGIKLVKPEDK